MAERHLSDMPLSGTANNDQNSEMMYGTSWNSQGFMVQPIIFRTTLGTAKGGHDARYNMDVTWIMPVVF